MPEDDERLAALIDNELGDEEKNALLERLAQDEALRERLAALRQDRDRLVASFDALLGQAPLARLRAAIPAADAEPPLPVRSGPRSAGSNSLPGSSSAFCLRAPRHGSDSEAGGRPERESWRQAVIEYMDLYTPDTFALANPDSAVQAKQLQAVSAKVGVDLTPDKVALPDLRYRVGAQSRL